MYINWLRGSKLKPDMIYAKTTWVGSLSTPGIYVHACTSVCMLTCALAAVSSLTTSTFSSRAARWRAVQPSCGQEHSQFIHITNIGIAQGVSLFYHAWVFTFSFQLNSTSINMKVKIQSSWCISIHYVCNICKIKICKISWHAMHWGIIPFTSHVADVFLTHYLSNHKTLGTLHIVLVGMAA